MNGTYNEPDYDQLFVRARDLLAELKWVDDSLAYLDAPFLVDEPTIGEQASTGLTRLTAQLGRTHPFTAVGHSIQPQYMQRQVPLILPDLDTQAQKWADTVADSIRNSLRHLKNSVSGDIADVVWTLHDEVIRPLEDIEEADIGMLGETLGHWRGEAAGAFSRDFYAPFQEVNQQQRLQTARLAAALALQKAILDAAQNGMMNAVTTMAATLDEQLRNREAVEAAESQAEIDTAATALSLIGNVVGAVPTPAGAVGGGVAGVLSDILSFASAGIPSGDVRTLHVPVVSADDAATLWSDAATHVVRANRSHQHDFATKEATALVEGLEGALERRRMFPPAPTLLGVTPEAFHHDSSEVY